MGWVPYNPEMGQLADLGRAYSEQTFLFILTLSHTHTLSLSLSVSLSLSLPIEYAVRLVDGGTLNQGRVEVYHSDEWGSICDDSFGFEEAEVICHELGYPGADDSHP